MSPERPHWYPAYVGLGSNLDDPRAHVERALRELGQVPASRLTASSSLYRSAPLGPKPQGDYVNAVAALVTRLTPADLLTELLRIEAHVGGSGATAGTCSTSSS